MSGYDHDYLLYDEQNNNRELEQKFYCSLLRGDHGKLLDVACGTGVLTISMAQANPNWDIIGLDLSYAMVNVARSRAPWLKWIVADMTNFQLKDTFDVITCTFNATQHLLEDHAVVSFLSTCRAHLSRNGRLCIDLLNPSEVFLQPRRNGCFVTRFYSNVLEGQIEVSEDTSYDRVSRIFNIDYHYRLSTEGGGARLVRTSSYRMRQYFPEDIDALVARAALGIHYKLGSFAGDAFVAGSPKQILICGAA